MAYFQLEKMPSCLALYQSGELYLRIQRLHDMLKQCSLCPRRCGVDRTAGEIGVCNAGATLKVSSAFPHFGEERPLVGRRGSGTIFFSHCNLRCSFCQNYDISHHGAGDEVSPAQLSGMMMSLQNAGCLNINFVTPTHFVPYIVAALPQAIQDGLKIPLVYNCSGYESLEVIELLDGIIDIYMPDAKFSSVEHATRFACAGDYFSVLKPVLKEMHRQVGSLKTTEHGDAYRGLLIRHLVMPNDTAGSREILRFIATELGADSYVNIMNQYRPCFHATADSLINRPITSWEYQSAIELAKEFGLNRGF
ncbi:MAG: radical SAM protein [Candidatus Zhuqueibacterota bacterium]